MNIKIFLFTLIAMQSAYAFSADERSLLVQGDDSQAVSRCDMLCKPKHYCAMLFGGSIGGALAGGIDNALSNYCIYSCPLNVTTTPFGTIASNIILSSTLEVTGCALLGAGIIATGIGCYRFVKYCCGTPQNTQQDIA